MIQYFSCSMIKIMTKRKCGILNVGPSSNVWIQHYKQHEKCRKRKWGRGRTCWIEVTSDVEERVFKVPKGYTCPKIVDKSNWYNKDKFNDTFKVTQKGQIIKVRRTDPMVKKVVKGDQQRGTHFGEKDWCDRYWTRPNAKGGQKLATRLREKRRSGWAHKIIGITRQGAITSIQTENRQGEFGTIAMGEGHAVVITPTPCVFARKRAKRQ